MIWPFKKTLRKTTLYAGLSIGDWRSSETRVSWARRMWHDRTFSEMLEVLRNSKPIPHGVMNEHQALIELGVQIGYQRCLDVIHMLPEEALVMHDVVEPDYGMADKDNEPE